MEYQLEELLPIVAQVTEQYTSKESTSVSYEIAEQLMGAVIYCINEFEQNNSAYNATLPAELKRRAFSARMAYDSGKQFVREKVQKAQKLYHSILLEFCDYGNLAYRETILDGMPNFFLKYDFRFCPQDHLLTLDYPVLTKFDAKICGIDLIYMYLQAVKVEQEFLRNLPKEYITFLLSSCPYSFADAFENIPAFVIKNMLGCRLGKRKITMTPYTDYEIRKLSENLECEIQNHTLETHLMDEFDNIVEQLPEISTEACCYFKQCIPDFGIELENAWKHQCLGTILILT